MKGSVKRQIFEEAEEAALKSYSETNLGWKRGWKDTPDSQDDPQVAEEDPY